MELTKPLQNFTNSKFKLNSVLENLQNFHSKNGLGFVKRINNKRRPKGSNKTITKKHFGFINYFNAIKEVII